MLFLLYREKVSLACHSLINLVALEVLNFTIALICLSATESCGIFIPKWALHNVC